MNEVDALKHLLHLERIKSKIYKQILKQKLNLDIDDSIEDVVNEVATKRLCLRLLEEASSQEETMQTQAQANQVLEPENQLLSQTEDPSPQEENLLLSALKEARNYN